MRKGEIQIGQMLIDKGIITAEQLDAGLRERQRSSGFIGVALIKLGFASEQQILSALSEQLNIPYAKLKDAQISKETIQKVPAKFASHYKIMPIKFEENLLTLAVTDPMDLHTLDDVRLLLDCDITTVLAGENDILDAIKRYYGIGADTVDKIMEETTMRESMAIAKASESTDEMADL